MRWAKMAPHCMGKLSDPGRSGSDNRRFVEAVLWIARTGSAWRELPVFFGKWNTVFKRFRDWVKADIFQRLFDAVSDEPDLEYAMVDATSSRCTATARVQKGDFEPGYRQMKGGMTTKILALKDALGDRAREGGTGAFCSAAGPAA